jgi:hypothetical protein
MTDRNKILRGPYSERTRAAAKAMWEVEHEGNPFETAEKETPNVVWFYLSRAEAALQAGDEWSGVPK